MKNIRKKLVLIATIFILFNKCAYANPAVESANFAAMDFNEEANVVAEAITNAIYIVEGGSSTPYPYGIREDIGDGWFRSKPIPPYSGAIARGRCLFKVGKIYRAWVLKDRAPGLFVDYLGDRYNAGNKKYPEVVDKTEWKRRVRELVYADPSTYNTRHYL